MNLPTLEGVLSQPVEFSQERGTKDMIKQELFTKIKLIGVESGIIEIYYASFGFDPAIVINFYDEDRGVDYLLDSINLGDFSPIKESYMIGEFELNRIKNSEEAIRVE